MTVRLILLILSFGVAMTGIFYANRTTYAMIEEINRKRPKDRQVSYFWFSTAQKRKIYEEYRQLYREDKLGKRRRRAYAAIVIGLAASAMCLLLRFQ
jgi:hypothetical protein